MKKSSKKINVNKYDVPNGITKEIKTLDWTDNITVINLSNKNIFNLGDSVKFPPKLIDLNIAHNNLTEIPGAIIKLSTLKVLDISNNKVENFDTKPNFCNSLEQLNLANNRLHGPPRWVWVESPSKLTQLDLSGNVLLINSEANENLEELLEYNTLVTELKVYNCRIRTHLELMQTFKKIKVLEFGCTQISCYASNWLEEFPCSNFKQCCDIERLNLSSVHLYCINSSIDTFKNLIEINLAQNNLDGLPNEFCHLENLEICILSFNKILYLPEDMVKLKKLNKLCINSNILCMIPEHLCELPSLKVLDLYDNNLHEVPEEIRNVPELDLAQNFFEEPRDEEYLKKKEKLRLNVSNRENGRKPDESTLQESECSPDTTDDEELIYYMENTSRDEPHESREMGTPEDWDSDEYWTPGFYRKTIPPREPLWMYFIKQKMGEGNFCPMDMHIESVTDKVKREILKKSKLFYEVEGQFDDWSGDDEECKG